MGEKCFARRWTTAYKNSKNWSKLKTWNFSISDHNHSLNDLKIQKSNIIYGPRKIRFNKMCALSVSLHFLHALSLSWVRERTQKVWRHRERAHKNLVEREHTFSFQYMWQRHIFGPYYISHIIWLIFVQDLFYDGIPHDL